MYVKGYDNWKTGNNCKDEPAIIKDTGFFLNKIPVEYDNDYFYCNNETITIEEANKIIDEIQNANHNRPFNISFYVFVFGIYVSFSDFIKMYDFYM